MSLFQAKIKPSNYDEEMLFDDKIKFSTDKGEGYHIKNIYLGNLGQIYSRY